MWNRLASVRDDAGGLNGGLDRQRRGLPLLLKLAQECGGVVDQQLALGFGELAPAVAAAAAVTGWPQGVARTVALGKAGGAQHQQLTIVAHHMDAAVHRVAAAALFATDAGAEVHRNNGAEFGHSQLWRAAG